MSILFTLLFWTFMLPILYLSGSIFKPWVHEKDSILVGVIFFALGLGIIGFIVITFGTVGLLKPIWVFPAVAVLPLLKLKNFKNLKLWMTDTGSFLFSQPTSRFGRTCRWIFSASILISLAACFAPEIANDSLAYHLQLPKMFIKHASNLPLIFDEKSYRSLFIEQLFVLPMFFKSVSSAILFHWFSTLLLIIFMIRYFQNKTGNYSFSYFLGTLFWLTPTLFNQVSISYSDGMVAFFGFIAFYFMMRVFEECAAKTQNILGFLTGIFLGLSISSKFVSLHLAFAMGVGFIYLTIAHKKPFSFFLRIATGVLLGTFLTSAYWFIRNYLLTGSPLYPLISKNFGSSGLYDEQNFAGIGVSKSILNFILLPFLTFIYPQLFDFHHWIGPFYTFLVPIGAWGAFKNKSARVFFLIALVGTTLWFQTAQNIRFLLPVFPFLLMSSSLGLKEIKNLKLSCYMRYQLWVQFILCTLLFSCLAIGIYHYRAQLESMIRLESSADFLARYERSYPIAQWANKNLPPNSKVFNAWEVRTFYFDPIMIDSYMFYRLNRTSIPLWNSQILYAKLKEIGITHILISYLSNDKSEGSLEKKELFPGLNELIYDETKTKSLVKMDSENIRESQYTYRIYQLN